MHSRYSHDSNTALEELASRARELGLARIALTDHNTAQGALVFQDMEPELVIAGEEVKTTEGEVIGLFITRTIKAWQRPEAVMDEIHEMGGLVYIPHPFDRWRANFAPHRLVALASRIDVIEGYNQWADLAPTRRRRKLQPSSARLSPSAVTPTPWASSVTAGWRSSPSPGPPTCWRSCPVRPLTEPRSAERSAGREAPGRRLDRPRHPRRPLRDRHRRAGRLRPHFALAASLVRPVEIVAPVGADAWVAVQAVLAGRPVDLSRVSLLDLPTYRWSALQQAGTNLDRGSIDGIYDRWEPDLPPGYDGWAFVGSMRPDRQLLAALSLRDSARLLAADSMRSYLTAHRERAEQVLGAAGWFFANREELLALGGDPDEPGRSGPAGASPGWSSRPGLAGARSGRRMG